MEMPKMSKLKSVILAKTAKRQQTQIKMCDVEKLGNHNFVYVMKTTLLWRLNTNHISFKSHNTRVMQTQLKIIVSERTP